MLPAIHTCKHKNILVIYTICTINKGHKSHVHHIHHCTELEEKLQPTKIIGEILWVRRRWHGSNLACKVFAVRATCKPSEKGKMRWKFTWDCKVIEMSDRKFTLNIKRRCFWPKCCFRKVNFILSIGMETDASQIRLQGLVICRFILQQNHHL
jgi:hypothetical protein